MPPDILLFQLFKNNSALSKVIFIISMAVMFNLHAAPFGLRATDQPKTITLREAFLMVENYDKSVLLAKEKIVEQKASSWRVWSAYLPKLELSGTYTFNFPEAKAQIFDDAQSIQSAQTSETLADLLDVTQPLRTDPALQEQARTQSALLRQMASSMRRNKSNPLIIQPAQLFEARLTLTQPILNLEAIANIKKNSLQIKQAEKEYLHKLSQVKIDVARSYFLVLQKFNDVQASRNRLTRAQSLTKRSRNKFTTGLARYSDVNRLEAEAATARETLIQKESDLEFAKGTLGMQIGEQMDFKIEHFDVPVLSSEHSGDYFVEAALAHRQDFQASQKALKAAEQGKLGAYFNLVPTVSAVAQGLYTTNTVGLIDEPITAAILLKANWVLFDGGERYARIREQKSEVYKAKINSADLERRIEHEVLGVLVDIEAKNRVLKAVQESLNAYRLVYKESTQMFDQGLSDVADTINSNHELADAESRYANAKLGAQLAELELADLTGHLHEVLKQ